MSTTLRDCYNYGGKNGGSKFCHFPPRSSSSNMARRSRPWQQRKQPLQHRFKKKRKNCWRIPPRAPRNTTSFIMRSNRMGILAAMASPATTTPLLLHTPIISPVPWPQESLGDGQSSNEFKVDAYGSMKGCIRLRPEAAAVAAAAEEQEQQQQQGISCSENNKSAAAGGGDRRSSGIDAVTSVQQLEERLDHGLLQKFEMINRDLSPWSASSSAKNEEHASLCSAMRMEDQETHIAYLEEENLSLQQRLLSMQHELHHLRRRLGSSVAKDDPCYCSDESMGNGSCAS